VSARDWADLRAPEVAGLDPARAVAVLPVAAVEQHGPHLPLGTDLRIAEGMLAEVRRRCPDDLELLFLPVQAVGKSNEHLFAPGTLTLDAATALAAWTEIGLSVARAGLRKLVVVTSHGGNAAVVEILARELRIRAGMLCVRASWGGFGQPEGLFSARERRFGIHGGDVETSLMLHFRPETVDMDAARDFASSAEVTALPPTGWPGYGWIATDLNPEGVAGEAHLATAAKGAALAAHAAEGFLALARAVAGWDWRPAG
jgi:creatinine amidohydrolase